MTPRPLPRRAKILEDMNPDRWIVPKFPLKWSNRVSPQKDIDNIMLPRIIDDSVCGELSSKVCDPLMIAPPHALVERRWSLRGGDFHDPYAAISKIKSHVVGATPLEPSVTADGILRIDEDVGVLGEVLKNQFLVYIHLVLSLAAQLPVGVTAT